ncbi:immunity protein YezG family protein [Priestia koreensis]|uniref:immunity protein YezG family protein n=1 Tax=Priestia koreensis TaxID=284581 RepID=UPI001F56CA76|nr:immunity protein YezG family protein [Priestia koreensis]UNL83221.1 DUF600 family protein [Priestia koreensis]
MKEFKDQFSELQGDMISICLEYVEDRADKVYVYGSCEEGITASAFFFLINDIYVKPHKLNDAVKGSDEKYDTSSTRNLMVLNILNEDIEKVSVLCKEHQREMPTEMKLIYDVKSGKFKAEYKYDFMYIHDDIKTSDDIYDEWFEEVKKSKL